jgi:hypothetical protein
MAHSRGVRARILGLGWCVSGNAPRSCATDRLRGRDDTLLIVGEHPNRLLCGIGTVLDLEGGAGMGKNRLLAEVARMAVGPDRPEDC